MVLNSIDLKNFRLHRNTQIKFSNKINYIVGGNGQGKTSLLEAIYYLCTTKSINQSSDSEAVTFLEDSFDIAGNFFEYSKNNVRVSFEKLNNKKAVFVDQKQIHKASELIGRFPVVALLQTDHGITQGSPIERRRFVDSIISQASTTYLKLLLDYNKVLRNRSSLLYKLKESGNNELYDQLDAWTESLLKLGTEIIRHRMKFVEEFNEFIQLPYEYIMGKAENPRIFYSTFIDQNGEIKDSFSKRLSEVRNDELRRARNLVGPHRDDFDFFINDLELKKYGSQGQNKTFQIALRFSQFFYMKSKSGITPIFLMDDVFGELDSYRAERISNYLSEIGQAFITMTDFSKIENLNNAIEDFVFNVKEGNVAHA